MDQMNPTDHLVYVHASKALKWLMFRSTSLRLLGLLFSFPKFPWGFQWVHRHQVLVVVLEEARMQFGAYHGICVGFGKCRRWKCRVNGLMKVEPKDLVLYFFFQQTFVLWFTYLNRQFPYFKDQLFQEFHHRFAKYR